ncbi:MAG: PEGA domain-containing protein [bacterium]
MKTKLLSVALALVAAVPSAMAQTGEKFAHNADFTMLVEVQSDPPGADIYTVPATTNNEPVKIGATPYMALVDLTWKRGWFLKHWSRLSVWTPGDLARADYTSKQELYEIYLHFTLSKEGYESEEFGELIASFDPPRDLDYDRINFIPGKKVLNLSLKPVSSGEPEPAPVPVAASKTVMIAGAEGEADELGTVHVVANVTGAEVLVDGNFAGVTPIKLLVRAGRHGIVVSMPGYTGFAKTMDIKPRREVVLKVSLNEAAPVP